MANRTGKWGGGSQGAPYVETFDDGSIAVNDGSTTTTLTPAQLAALKAGTLVASSEATNVGDKVCTAVLALGASAPGATAKALTLTLKQADGSTALTSVRVATIRVIAGADAGNPLAEGVSTVTFGSATVGSIVGSGAGWATVLTNAAGAFACTCSDSADETVIAFVESPAVSDTLAHSCLILPSAYVQAEWA